MCKTSPIKNKLFLKDKQKELYNTRGMKEAGCHCFFFSSNLLRPSILPGILILSFMVCMFCGCAKDASKEDLDAIKQKIDQLEIKITTFEEQAGELKDSVNKLNSYGKTFKEHVTILEDKIDKLAQKVDQIAPMAHTHTEKIKKVPATKNTSQDKKQ